MDSVKTAPHSKRHPLLLYGIVIFAVYALYVFLLVPLYVAVCANVAYSDTVWVYLTGELYRLADLFCLLLTYSLLVWIRFSQGRKTARRLLGIYLAASVFKNIGNTVADWLTVGFDATDAGFDILYALFSCGLEALFALVLFLPLNRCNTNFEAAYSIRQKAAAELETAPPSRVSLVFPLPLLPDTRNPLSFGCLLGAVVLLTSRLGNRIVYDISYGAPETAGELLTMLLSYLADIAIAVLYYFLAPKLLEKWQRQFLS